MFIVCNLISKFVNTFITFLLLKSCGRASLHCRHDTFIRIFCTTVFMSAVLPSIITLCFYTKFQVSDFRFNHMYRQEYFRIFYYFYTFGNFPVYYFIFPFATPKIFIVSRTKKQFRPVFNIIRGIFTIMIDKFVVLNSDCRSYMSNVVFLHKCQLLEARILM
jgi:hypothetical protein